MSSLVQIKTAHGQVYWYNVDAKSGKKTRVPAPSSRPSALGATSREATSKAPRGLSGLARGRVGPGPQESKEEKLRVQVPLPTDYDADRDKQRDRIAEHCTFIAVIARLTGLPDAESVVKRSLLLRKAWQKAATTDACRRIVPSMRRLITDVESQLKRAKARACYVALMEHMLRELQVFQEFLEDPDYFRKRHAREHLAEFAGQDAEAQLFVACDVPALVNAPSPLLDGLVRQCVDLALQLNDVAKRALATAEPHKGDLLVDVLPDYIELRAKHVASSRDFLRNVLPRLDMSAELAGLVRQLVVHEIRESDWAFTIVERNIAP
jgi:hypothetical protein